jgi:hypothetical protein
MKIASKRKDSSNVLKGTNKKLESILIQSLTAISKVSIKVQVLILPFKKIRF